MSGAHGARGADDEHGTPGTHGARAGRGGPEGTASAPRIPLPRAPAENGAGPAHGGRQAPEAPEAPEAEYPVPDHHHLTSLLGAWALAACSPEEAAAVEEHLGKCPPCAEEARRLREAVGLLRRPESLDPDPALRARVLSGCLERRPPRVPVPGWAAPYDAETARLDALLQDIGDAEWHAPVRLRWFTADGGASRRTTVAGVLGHLLSVDGLVAVALGLPDPLGGGHAPPPAPAGRTEAYWDAARSAREGAAEARAAHDRAGPAPSAGSVRGPWREQSHAIVRTVSATGGGGGAEGGSPVSYGDFALPLRDALLDRAFECWVHAQDIAEAVHYPYRPPAPPHLHRMIDLAARMLPEALAERRRSGPAGPGPGTLPAAEGAPGRSLRLEIEGLGGGEWLIPLDAPGPAGSAAREVAHVALDDVEFCHLAAGRVAPVEAAAGQAGDREAIRDVLFATASLSRM
ncbi:anti-sigma factor [Streptomyces sp. SHP 1-2]|uniref:anti-sigma factor n=1 Tax=Streptomyces sp. SHP 1-2 TaxID=2769489 RepID=UPI00223754F1|nr:anti-sigma factor [Streptomyces sp. SHP 1-2]MCW5250870.1 zf-HC2 domain-containing protein [Streptomyces sp. SHP 1-2]